MLDMCLKSVDLMNLYYTHNSKSNNQYRRLDIVLPPKIYRNNTHTPLPYVLREPETDGDRRHKRKTRSHNPLLLTFLCTLMLWGTKQMMTVASGESSRNLGQAFLKTPISETPITPIKHLIVLTWPF